MDSLNKSGEKSGEVEEANPITLLKNPQKFKDTFFEISCLASECLKTQEYEKALKSLSKCLDMLDLGKNILKDLSKYWKLCIYGNLACAYQGQLILNSSTWKMQKCHKYCEKMQEELEKHLGAATSKEHFLNVNKHLIRVKFQHCAILSQLNQHQKALEMCKSTLPSLQSFISSILEYTESLATNSLDKKSSQIVEFSKQVSSFAEQILNNLIVALNEPIEASKGKSEFYYWQKNPENNEEQVKRKFVSGKQGESCKRSILGVHKITHWIDEFNIGTIMHMNELTINDFEQTLPIEEYLFKDKLYETVIHCSVAHFTIATEMRFIQSSREGDGNGQPGINQIQKKYGYEEKSELFKLSELYHLKAINIMSKNIKTQVPYISHLIKSYDKHYIYKKQLEPIQAIIEESAMSVSELKSRQPKPSHEEDNYYGYVGYKQEQIPPENMNILEDVQESQNQPIQTARESNQIEESQQDSNMVPTYIAPSDSRNLSRGKKRHKSMGRIKPKVTVQAQLKTKRGKEEKGKKGKQTKKRKNDQDERELRIKHESCTQIKMVFKKKK